MYDSPLRTAPRHAQEGYVQPPLQPSLLDRPPAYIRRTSEQDIALPSVERETVSLASPQRASESQRFLQDPDLPRGYVDVQSPKRKAAPSVPDRHYRPEQSNKRLRPVHHKEEFYPQAYQGQPPQAFHYDSQDARGRSRAHPPQQVVDLTSSPHRPSNGINRGHCIPARLYPNTEPNGPAYVPVPSRRSPPREARGAYYEVPADASYRAYTPDHRMYERCAPPGRDRVPMRDARQRPYVEEENARYLRNGTRYGG